MRLFWLKVILVGLFRQGNIVHGSCVTSPKTNIFGQDNIAARHFLSWVSKICLLQDQIALSKTLLYEIQIFGTDI